MKNRPITLLSNRPFSLSERGMSFRSRHQFPVCTELSVRLAAKACKGIRTEGIVVDCTPDMSRRGTWRTTLFFPEMSENLKAELRNVSACLAHSES